MTTIVMDMDGCDRAHEALLLKEFGEQVKYAVQYPQRTLAGKSPLAKISRNWNSRGRADLSIIDLPSAANEVGDSVRFVLPSTFPKCP